MEILAHRGDTSSEQPENTVAAVEAALAAGADGVEVDVRLTADGVPVCVHDPDLRRIAGLPHRVAATTYADLRRVRLPGGERVASLDEVVAAAAAAPLLVVDVRHDPGAAAEPLAAQALPVLRRRRVLDRSIVSSFSEEVLRATRRLEPAARRALITEGVPAVVALTRAVAAGHFDVHIDVRSVLADHVVVERAARLGRTVRAWPVNRAVDAVLLDVAGVSGAITDDVTALRAGSTGARPEALR
jgi:glycerophosphoryl diester phosphodiesterase